MVDDLESRVDSPRWTTRCVLHVGSILLIQAVFPLAYWAGARVLWPAFSWSWPFDTMPALASLGFSSAWVLICYRRRVFGSVTAFLLAASGIVLSVIWVMVIGELIRLDALKAKNPLM